MTRVLELDPEHPQKDALELAASIIVGGGLVAFPTETVYGLGADAMNEDAVRKIYVAKGRPADNPCIVHVDSRAMLDRVACRVSPIADRLIQEFWPGPLTLVCRQQGSLMWDLGETLGTVAVRMPDDEVALAVLERTGPLAVSSANLTSMPAATDADQAEKMLGSAVSVIVDGGASPGGEASTIIDVTVAQGRVLRLGALSLEQLNAALEEHGVVLEEQV